MNKQHILKEIKRTAEENGGLPLGLDRFSLETGIRYNDEAGLSPNKFVTEGYGEEVLTEKYAALVRELGRVP